MREEREKIEKREKRERRERRRERREREEREKREKRERRESGGHGESNGPLRKRLEGKSVYIFIIIFFPLAYVFVLSCDR